MTGLFIVNVLMDGAQCHDLESLDLTIEEGGFAVTVYSNGMPNMTRSFLSLHYMSGLLRTFGFSRMAPQSILPDNQ